SGAGLTTTDTSSQRGRIKWWTATFGEHFGAGRGADTLTSRANGFGRNTSELLVNGIGRLLPKPEGTMASREFWRYFMHQILGSSDTSELNRTLTHSIRLGTPTSYSVKVRGCWSGCRIAASQDDSGSRKKANALDAVNSSTKTTGGGFNPSSHSKT